MTRKERYNGWSNYETWNVALWISNEEGSDSYWREAAQECWDEAAPDETFTRQENAAYKLADRLKSEVEDGMPELTGFYGDLLRASLSEVDYREIAANWLEDVDEDDGDA